MLHFSPRSISTALATKGRWIVHALLTCLLPVSPHNILQDCRRSGGRYHSVSFTTLSPVPSTGPAIGQALGKCLWEEGGRQGTRPWCPLQGQPSGGSLREGSPGSSCLPFPGTGCPGPESGSFLSPQAHLGIFLFLSKPVWVTGGSPLPAPTVASHHHSGHTEGWTSLSPSLQGSEAPGSTAQVRPVYWRGGSRTLWWPFPSPAV